MIEPGSEYRLRLDAYAWDKLITLAQRLHFAGHPAPADLLDGLVELGVEPVLTDEQIAARFGDVGILAHEGLAAFHAMTDVFSESDRQRALRQAVELLRTEARL